MGVAGQRLAKARKNTFHRMEPSRPSAGELEASLNEELAFPLLRDVSSYFL